MSAAEDEITEWFARQRQLPGSDFPIGIGDDMAEISLADGVSVLITTDMLLDGVHFDLKKATLEQVGYKAMAASLSDCAAMATVPVAAVVSVALPQSFGKEQLKRLHAGIISAADRFSCPLIGGDITRWHAEKSLAISVAVLSRTAGTEPVKRSGAKVGDVICVTGSLGGALTRRHLEFEPRVTEALRIARMVKVNAMIDISDGLSTDLNRICRSSGVGALIDADKIPLSGEAKKTENPLDSALNEGEDFELLFTLADSHYRNLLERWDEPVTITRIGAITDTGNVQIKIRDGLIEELQAGGYDHLK